MQHLSRCYDLELQQWKDLTWVHDQISSLYSHAYYLPRCFLTPPIWIDILLLHEHQHSLILLLYVRLGLSLSYCCLGIVCALYTLEAQCSHYLFVNSMFELPFTPILVFLYVVGVEFTYQDHLSMISSYLDIS